jgi:hypothetical protein
MRKGDPRPPLLVQVVGESKKEIGMLCSVLLCLIDFNDVLIHIYCCEIIDSMLVLLYVTLSYSLCGRNVLFVCVMTPSVSRYVASDGRMDWKGSRRKLPAILNAKTMENVSQN